MEIASRTLPSRISVRWSRSLSRPTHRESRSSVLQETRARQIVMEISPAVGSLVLALRSIYRPAFRMSPESEAPRLRIQEPPGTARVSRLAFSLGRRGKVTGTAKTTAAIAPLSSIFRRRLGTTPSVRVCSMPAVVEGVSISQSQVGRREMV